MVRREEAHTGRLMVDALCQQRPVDTVGGSLTVVVKTCRVREGNGETFMLQTMRRGALRTQHDYYISKVQRGHHPAAHHRALPPPRTSLSRHMTCTYTLMTVCCDHASNKRATAGRITHTHTHTWCSSTRIISKSDSCHIEANIMIKPCGRGHRRVDVDELSKEGWGVKAKCANSSNVK